MAKNNRNDIRTNAVLIIALLTLGSLSLYLINDNLMQQQEAEQIVSSTRKVGVVTTIKTRFMAIYNGTKPTSSTRQQSATGLSTMPSVSFNSAQPRQGVATQPVYASRTQSAIANTNVGGLVVPTQSSATTHSIGGTASNSSMAVANNGHAVGQHGSYTHSGIVALPATGRTSRTISGSTPNQTTGLVTLPETSEPVFAAGPRRAAYDGATPPVSPTEGDTWKDGYGVTWVFSGGDWERVPTEDAGNPMPMGDTTLPLLLFAALFATIRFRRCAHSTPNLGD